MERDRHKVFVQHFLSHNFVGISLAAKPRMKYSRIKYSLTIVAACLMFWLGRSTAIAQNSANQTPEKSGTIRVLSYNIHHAEGVDGRLDVPRIARVIASTRPDIVALQEVDDRVKRSESVDQAAELARLTGMKHAFGGNIELQGGHYGNAVLSRGEMKVLANHKLPNIDKGEQRGVLDVMIDHQGRQVRVLATHFDHRRDPRERLESAAKVNQLAQTQPDMPTLLIGDLNAAFDSDVLKDLRKTWQLTNTRACPQFQ